MPPVITSQPDSMLTYNRNERQELTVHFQSKSINDTLISWYKDNTSLQDSVQGRQDILDPLGSQTRLSFEPIRRSDGGEFRVVIENSHRIIPTNQRMAEARFTVKVLILPSTPTQLNARGISDQAATLSWTLDSITSDESPDNQTITIHYAANNTMAKQVAVPGERRDWLLHLVPGMNYRVRVVARNQDGIATSEQYQFQTLTGGRLFTGFKHAPTIAVNIQLNAAPNLLRFNLQIVLMWGNVGEMY